MRCVGAYILALPLGRYLLWVLPDRKPTHQHDMCKRTRERKTQNANESASGAASANAASPGSPRWPPQHRLAKQSRATGVALLLGPWPVLGPRPDACAGRARAQAGKCGPWPGLGPRPDACAGRARAQAGKCTRYEQALVSKRRRPLARHGPRPDAYGMRPTARYVWGWPLARATRHANARRLTRRPRT